MNSNKLVDISDVKNSPRSLANDVSANIGSVRALLDAIDDGLHLMMDKTSWGPTGQLWSIEEATCESSWPLLMVFCLTWIVIRMKL